jgi:pimeloyl-ACP methyl ester carboxylesterase
MTSAEDFEAYTKLLPNARTLTIQAARHMPHLEQPEALALAVRTFLEN